MATRFRVRVGRRVSYQPTDSEATTGGDASGAQWPATISLVNADGTVNLAVVQGNGAMLAKTSVAQGSRVGFFSLSPV